MATGHIAFTPSKRGKTVWLPAAPQLVEAIEAMPVTRTAHGVRKAIARMAAEKCATNAGLKALGG